MVKNKKRMLGMICLISFALIVVLAACSPTKPAAENSASSKVPTVAEVTQSTRTSATPGDPDKFGVITAEGWSQVYPRQYASYLLNSKNSPDSGKHDYLELYPSLKSMYTGYAFALDYDEAASHTYTLESVSNTLRTVKKEQLANCITCKTPQFTAQVNMDGDGVYALKFNDMIGTFSEPVSCYNCHENDPETLTLTHKYWVKSLGKDVDNEIRAPKAAQVCGQCHNEYYFNPETKVTTNPYTGLDAMDPDAILAYYDDMNFKDWSHGITGAPMVKVQHPEFETLYGKTPSRMAMQGYSCADCHMSTATDDEGVTYTSHNWISPLENQELVKSCNMGGTCHSDIASQVAKWQEKSEERVHAINAKIGSLIEKIGSQVTVEDGKATLNPDATITEEQLAQAQRAHRVSQFYWDFVMVENSEGAHNVELANETLDKSEKAVDEGLAIFA